MGLYGCCIPFKELADNLIFTPSPLPQHITIAIQTIPTASVLVHNEKNVSKKEKKNTFQEMKPHSPGLKLIKHLPLVQVPENKIE